METTAKMDNLLLTKLCTLTISVLRASNSTYNTWMLAYTRFHDVRRVGNYSAAAARSRLTFPLARFHRSYWNLLRCSIFERTGIFVCRLYANRWNCILKALIIFLLILLFQICAAIDIRTTNRRRDSIISILWLYTAMQIVHIEILLAACDTPIACAVLLDHIDIGLLLKTILGSISIMRKRTFLLFCTLRCLWSQIWAKSVSLPLFRYRTSCWRALHWRMSTLLCKFLSNSVRLLEGTRFVLSWIDCLYLPFRAFIANHLHLLDLRHWSRRHYHRSQSSEIILTVWSNRVVITKATRRVVNVCDRIKFALHCCAHYRFLFATASIITLFPWDRATSHIGASKLRPSYSNWLCALLTDRWEHPLLLWVLDLRLQIPLLNLYLLSFVGLLPFAARWYLGMCRTWNRFQTVPAYDRRCCDICWLLLLQRWFQT